MRSTICTLSFVAALSMPAAADPALFGQTLYTPPAGQPLCRDAESLRRHLAAMLTRDENVEGIAGCSMISPGKEVVVTEDVSSDSDAMHVVRLRVFGVPPNRAIGYSVSMGLQRRR